MFQAILGTFWPFTYFQCRFDLPKLKLDLICSTIDIAYVLPHEFPDYSKLRIIRNEETLVKAQKKIRDTVYCPFYLLVMNNFAILVKRTISKVKKAKFPKYVLFCFDFLTFGQIFCPGW